MSEPFKVLIAGGGITGPVLAFWLARYSKPSRSIHVTVIEKASSLLKLGQGIDVEEPAKEIVKRMGILDAIKSRTTGEKGFRCVDNKNRAYAVFEQGGVTNELEIMRGDLSEVLMKAADTFPNVELCYNRHIAELVQKDDKVHVTIAKADGPSYSEDFHAVIAADGVRSKTRDMMLDPSTLKDCYHTQDMYVAFFSIPAQIQDKDYCRFQQALRGRSMLLRPVTEKVSSVYLNAIGEHPALAQSLRDPDRMKRRQAWAEAFADVPSGEFPRAISEMQTTDNFYTDQITQVKLPTWHNGRCAVVGDAAYCPSPITGQGTVLAFLGAYLMAGELSRSLDDPAAAFQEYENKFYSHVERAQAIPLGGKAHRLFNPQSWWGVWIVQTVLWLIATTRIWKVVPNMDDKFPLPDYI